MASSNTVCYAEAIGRALLLCTAAIFPLSFLIRIEWTTDNRHQHPLLAANQSTNISHHPTQILPQSFSLSPLQKLSVPGLWAEHPISFGTQILNGFCDYYFLTNQEPYRTIGLILRLGRSTILAFSVTKVKSCSSTITHGQGQQHLQLIEILCHFNYEDITCITYEESLASHFIRRILSEVMFQRSGPRIKHLAAPAVISFHSITLGSLKTNFRSCK